jgi:prepilin-type processing-associated H-X9-DG protein
MAHMQDPEVKWPTVTSNQNANNVYTGLQAFRHNREANYLYVDGHARMLPHDYLYQNLTNSQGKNVRHGEVVVAPGGGAYRLP